MPRRAAQHGNGNRALIAPAGLWFLVCGKSQHNVVERAGCMRRKKESVFEELRGFFVEMPWWVGPPVAAVAYFFFSALVPRLMAASTNSGANPSTGQFRETMLSVFVPLSIKVAPLAAALVLLVWLFALVQKGQGRSRLRAATDLRKIRELSWETFEQLVGDYYRAEGYHVTQRGGPGPDGGVDLELRRGGERVLVQCKHWKGFKVGVAQARELCGVMTHEGARRGVLVSSGHFSQDARDFARQNGIEVVDGPRLAEMIRIGREHRTGGILKESAVFPPAPPSRSVEPPACPKCGGPMVLRTARKGPNAGSNFWGCGKFPSCSGTRTV